MLALHSNPLHAQALAALGQRRSALQTERETLELEWLELAERIEAG
jgi:hypothetical protein